MARLSDGFRHGVEARFEPRQPHCVGQDQRGHGKSFSLAARVLAAVQERQSAACQLYRARQKGPLALELWTYPGASSFGSDARRGLEDHPTVKPTVMLADALLDLTNRGEIVLDPFLGSGSTLIAAERTGRRCRGVELDPLYIDVILRRYQRETGESAVLEATGETFDELRENRSSPCGDARSLAGENPP
jgi:DNA methylase